jgi:hypothetical protein
MQALRFPTRLFVLAAFALLAFYALAGPKLTVDELKARLAVASIGARPRLCVQIAEQQLAEADKLYNADEIDKAQTSLADVTAFSELARDYAIQSHKRQKQTEIAVRAMARRLSDLLHTLPHNDQGPVKESINRLQRVCDDLLAAMFPKGAK